MVTYLKNMTPIKVFDSSYALVTFDIERKIIKVIWNGNHTVSEYKAAIGEALNFQRVSGFPVYTYLSDIRNQVIVNPESRKWFERVAIPQAVNGGLRRAAVVYDGSVFKNYYLNLILLAANVYQLPLKFFGSIEEAYEWIESFHD